MQKFSWIILILVSVAATLVITQKFGLLPPLEFSFAQAPIHFELENSQFSGPYAGSFNSLFSGAALYANGDAATSVHTFTSTSIPGKFRIDVKGASSNSNPAGVSLYVDNQKKGALTFDQNITTKSISFDIKEINPSKTIKFVLETDTGISDTYLDSFDIIYVGILPPSPLAPNPPSTGAAVTGVYRNLFKEIGKTDADINKKVEDAWQSLFHGDSSNQAVYREPSNGMAYIEDIAHSDIRTEGMSYAMMIAVQMNKKAEFDKLWNFAKTYMLCPRVDQCPTGSGVEGYLSWQIQTSPPYRAIDPNPAPDGEEYYTTALIFAHNRWGSTGINYKQDAQNLLNNMLKTNRPNGVNSMFNLDKKVIVFSPMGHSATYSDPSYHLPAFYEVWAGFDENPTQKTFWQQASTASRAYWKVASGHNSGRTNGLMPDCTDLSGNPTYGCAGGAIYAYDSWRTISNVAVDYAWWARDAWEKTQVDRFQSFFGPKRPTYDNQWNMDGTSAGGQQNSTGQIAMNAVAGLAGTTTQVWDFTEDLWNLSIPTGTYRYYDGLLYLMSLLHTSGKFRAYMSGIPSVPQPTVSSSPTPTPQPTAPTPKPTATPTPKPSASATPKPSVSPSPTLFTGSSITVFAAGTSLGGIYPTMVLSINDQDVATFPSVTGDINTRTFQTLNFKNLAKVSPSQLKVKFVNDEYNILGDRNLIVDKISIDGVNYETEEESTYSEGSWSDNSCSGGNKKSEWLHCNGYFSYATPTSSPPVDNSAFAVPGTVEAEQFSKFFKFNNKKVYIENCRNCTNGYNVGSIANGEWLTYPINALQSGDYSVSIRTATRRGDRFLHIEVDSIDVSGRLRIPYTNSWQRNWANTTSGVFYLTAGKHELKIVADTSQFNIDSFVVNKE